MYAAVRSRDVARPCEVAWPHAVLMSDASDAPDPLATADAVRSSLRVLAEQLGAEHDTPLDRRRLSLVLGRYVRAAVAARLTVEEAQRAATALVHSLALAQGWAAGSADAVAARLAALLQPMYAAEVRAGGH